MTVQSSYYARLRALADEERSSGRYGLSEHLLDRLEADFRDKKELFSADEYKDPDFSEALWWIFVRGREDFSVPREVTNFVWSILGPGRVLSLFSGFGEFLRQFGSGVGVEHRLVPARWSQFLLKIAGVDAEIVNHQPLHWESGEQFDRIVCTPPFGSQDGEFDAIEKALSLLKEEGQLAVIVSPNFLWGTPQAKAREAILKHASLQAVISLSPGVFANTSVRSAILVLSRSEMAKHTWCAPKNVADLNAIANDYHASRQGQKFTLGFEVATRFRPLGRLIWSSPLTSA